MVIVVTVFPPAPLMKGAPPPPPMVQRYDLWYGIRWFGLHPLMNPRLSQGWLSGFTPGWARLLQRRQPYLGSLYFTALDSAVPYTPFMGLDGLRLDNTIPVFVTPGTVGGEGWYYNRFLNPQAELAVYPLQWSVGYIPLKQPVSLVRRY